MPPARRNDGEPGTFLYLFHPPTPPSQGGERLQYRPIRREPVQVPYFTTPRLWCRTGGFLR